MMINDVIPYLKSLATDEALQDMKDINIQDCCGGNYDDAFDIGIEEGKILFARELLDKLGVPY